MKNMPRKIKLSVVIPIYNVEKYIDDCLFSVCSQSLREIEIICVDDCGQDKSMDIVRQYAQKDKRIRILRHEENMGLGISRNTGIEAATGEYIFFVDSDDYIQPDILEKLYNKITQTSSDIVGSRFYAFPDDAINAEANEKINTLNVENAFIRAVDQYKVSLVHYEEAVSIIPRTAWNKLYSTTFIRKNDLRFADQKKKITFEDEGFNIKLFSCKPVVSVIPDISVMYRIRERSITGTTSTEEHHYNMKLVLADAISYVESHLSPKEARLVTKAVKKMFSVYFPKRWYRNLYNVRWTQRNKMVKIQGIPVFRQKIELPGVKRTKILGITVHKEKMDDYKIISFPDIEA